jgi:putative spermidine/putrescine transport system permease protein
MVIGFGIKVLWRSMVALVYAAVLIPMLSIIWLSFFNQAVVTFPPVSYTFRWYVNAWETDQFTHSFFVSLKVALLATCVGLVLGAAAAYALVRSSFPGKTVVEGLLLGPLAIPGVVLGTGLYVFFVSIDNAIDFRLNGTLSGLVAAHSLLTLPWTVRLVTASLQGLDRSVEEAAANLGARPFTVFRRVTLPMMRAGVVAGGLFGFVQSFENLDMTLLLTGPGRSTLPIEMLNYMEFRIDPTLAAVATVQIVIIGAMMLITDRLVSLSRTVS